MVKIRLARQGAKKSPQYQIVVQNETKSRDGEYLEKLGYYYPQAEKSSDKLKLNHDSFRKWISSGARCSPRMEQLVKTLAKEAFSNEGMKTA